MPIQNLSYLLVYSTQVNGLLYTSLTQSNMQDAEQKTANIFLRESFGSCKDAYTYSI